MRIQALAPDDLQAARLELLRKRSNLDTEIAWSQQPKQSDRVVV